MRGKRKKSIITICLIMSLLTACGKKDKVDLPNVGILTSDGSGEGGDTSNAAGGSGKVVTLTPATGFSAPVITEDKNGDHQETVEDLLAAKKAAGITKDAVKRCMKEQTGRYMYDMMDDDLHTLYAEILLIVKAHAKDILVSTTDSDDLQTAFMCVFQDHPELFWIEGYSYGCYTRNGKTNVLTFSGKYSYSAEDCKTLQSKVDSWVDKCVWGMPSGADDYEKVKYAYQYVITHTDYVLGAPDNQNILSVMIGGESVCQGYAKALQYILNSVDIPCTMVIGKVRGGEGHAWNLVNLDGGYYYVDPTWGDSGYLSAAGMDVSKQGEVNYNYLNVTSDEIGRSHAADNVVAMPRCVATEDNYYVREGRCFEVYDEDAIRKLFDEARTSGSRYVSFKCDDDPIYRECVVKLLEERRIFALLPSGVNAVDYTTDDELNVLTFWF